MRRNDNFARLNKNYLFTEIEKRVAAFKAKEPSAKLISLSVGDTSQSIPPSIAKGLVQKITDLQVNETYSGYGPSQGDRALREKIAEAFYENKISADEIFISDGAKCDIGRLQLLFGEKSKIVLQNPTYPVYLDSSLLMGQTEISALPALPDNGFFPEFGKVKEVDLIYFCSPNNPTGVAATKEQLKELVSFAKSRCAVIIFDSAYAGFIRDPSLPRSIYEIEGAEECAIEVSSFSKLIGFTGVRLGWSVVPKALKYENGLSVHDDWQRVMATFFNGASNIAQAGGVAALTPEGVEEMRGLTDYYLENVRLLRGALQPMGYPIYGGEAAPYLWVDFGEERFQEFLERYHILTTPGSGFGSAGKGFLRFSGFGSREDILEATRRLKREVSYQNSDR
ncbi:MAG: LL-diaminopimelate aminotransferase [Chlamydiae bacterium]|nr:LL-diaminopimelate aminotransferase [Chlamydiota bacterium]